MPSGAATTQASRTLVARCFFNRSTVASADPPVASIGIQYDRLSLGKLCRQLLVIAVGDGRLLVALQPHESDLTAWHQVAHRVQHCQPRAKNGHEDDMAIDHLAFRDFKRCLHVHVPGRQILEDVKRQDRGQEPRVSPKVSVPVLTSRRATIEVSASGWSTTTTSPVAFTTIILFEVALPTIRSNRRDITLAPADRVGDPALGL